MTPPNRILVVAVAIFALLGAAAPAATATAGTGPGEGAALAQNPPSTGNNSTVSASLGQQLATVIAATSDDVETEVEHSTFEAEFETENQSERAEAVAGRAADLRERAREILADYREASAAYERGDISKDTYAQRLAILHARTKNVLSSLDRLQARAEEVPEIELRAADVNRSELGEVAKDLDALAGTGPAALLKQFDGRATGEVEIETADGLTIEVESEDGELSREVKRPDDGNDTIAVSQANALTTARASLSNHSWSLEKASVHEDDGYYKFEFGLRTANATGEAEVRVDGSSGEVFRLEEEIESSEREDDENESDEREDVALLLSGGTPGPNETVTVTAVADGEPVPNATVTLNGAVVETTDANGSLAVTLPGDEAKLAVAGTDAELEFEFEDRDEADDLYGDIRASGTVADGTATVTVTYDGSGVAGATVYGDDGRIGTTDADGTLTFTTDATDELELEIVKGEFAAELTLAVDGDQLSLVEAEPGDGEEREDEEDEREDEEDEDDEEDDEEETETEDEEDDSSGSGSGDGETETEDDSSGPGNGDETTDDSSGSGS